MNTGRGGRGALAIVAAVAVMLMAWSGSAEATAHARRPAAKPTTHTVVMDATSYTPATLTVRRGDSIVWVNKDMFPHTATSKPGGFDSGVVPTGGSWTWKATRTGEFPFSCTFHPTMKGTLHVK